jgi:hypothetical protein
MTAAEEYPQRDFRFGARGAPLQALWWRSKTAGFSDDRSENRSGDDLCDRYCEDVLISVVACVF